MDNCEQLYSVNVDKKNMSVIHDNETIREIVLSQCSKINNISMKLIQIIFRLLQKRRQVRDRNDKFKSKLQP